MVKLLVNQTKGRINKQQCNNPWNITPIYFFRKNNSISKCLSVKRLLFGFKTSFPVEKRRSTAALEGIGVLNLINKSLIEKTLKSKRKHLNQSVLMASFHGEIVMFDSLLIFYQEILIKCS